MSRPTLTIVSLLLTVFAALSCRNREPGPVAPAVPDTPPALALDEGLTIRLSHAEPEAGERVVVPQAKATSLAAADTAKVLARLSPMPSDPADVQAFAKRKGSTPPPRTGATVLGAFPRLRRVVGSTGRPEPLEVVRFAPQGDVPLAPHLSVTFNQPMVAMTSLDALDAKAVPVTLTPTPAGQWRWVGTRTLMFEPVERFPMATTYEVTVPAGTKSARSSALASAQTWSFTTPPPKVETTYPVDQPTRRQPVIFIGFDQRIEPAAIVSKIRLAAGRNRDRAVRLALPREVDADETVTQLATTAQPDRWLAVVPVAPLPSATTVRVTIGAGTPSAEGPGTTATAKSFSFRTFGPMKVEDYGCGYNNACPPGNGFNVNFTNPIDVETLDRSQVTVEPAIDGLTVQAYGQYLSIMGRTTGRTMYTVTLSPEIRDVFGQALIGDRTLEFSVTEAPSSLYMAGSGLTVLDPAAKGRVSVFSVNHPKLRVRAWSVKPDDWREYLLSTHGEQQYPLRFDPPGRLVFDEVMAVDQHDDEVVESPIDLSRALTGGLGHVILTVEQTDRPDEPWQMQRATAWIQSTGLGLQGHLDAERILVWATALADGTPRPGVDIELRHIGARAKTDDRGLASLPLGLGSAQMIVAREGDDVAFLPESISWWNAQGSWLRRDPHQHPTWYVFDDRGLYRPGEEVKLKGWLRRLDPRKGGDVGPIDGKVREVRYTLSDSRGNELVKDTLALNAFGAFDTTITLPDTMNLGRATVMLVVETGSKTNPFNAYGHTLRVEEFRRPEYEVKTRVSEGPHLVGSHAIATVEADYFAGGGLANAQVQWSVASAPGDYRPPGHDAFSFGKQRPWWMFWGGGGEDDEQTHHDLGFEARTDAAGEHHLKMDFVAVHPTQAMSVTAQASVTDVNRQSWTSSTAMVVHPSARYVGLRSDRTFVQAGEVLDIDAIVTSIDGVALSGVDVLVRAARVEYRFERGQWVEAEADPQTCETTSTTDAVRCSLPTTEGGTHRVVAVVVDEQGRANRTEILVWVAGGDLPASRRMGMESVLLIPDREQYAAGQTAKISVSAPWFPAEGLVTVRRSGIVDEKVIHLDGPSTIVEIPIAEAMTPMISVQVDLVGTAPRRDDDGKADSSLPGRPGFARGVVTLKVPPRQRTLDLTLTPEVGEIEPGGSTTIDVRVRDAAGNPVANAEVALVVVDEAVLSLTGYTLADPLEVFYGWRDPDVRDHYLRSHVLLAQPEGLERTEGQGRGGGGFGLIGNEADMAEGDVDEMARFEPETVALAADKRGSAPPSTPIAMRSDFSALAAFSPSVTTSAQGRAVVPVTVPDNLTRYRIMAVAVVGWTRFGHGESSITARLPLMVRPSAPRFLNFGDTMQLPVVLQNQTDAPMTVDVAVRAHNAELTDGAGRRVEVPAHDRVEVRFPSRAASAGTARFQVGATAGRWSDAASFSLPVWTPATSEAFATYGEIDEGSIVQPTLAPPDVFSEFGGLEITTSSTAVQALTDAVLYLASYPFECSEQRASRVLAVAALRDVLQAFEAEDLPTPEQLLTAVERDIDSLRRMQADDGGFSFWGRGWRSWPYLTVHVTHALERAHAKGFSVPSATRARAQDYLRNIEDHFDPKTPVEVRRVIRAYALYVLRLAGSPNPDQAAAVVDETGVEGLPLEALAWLLPTLHDDPSRAAMVATIQRHLDNKVTETASTAHFATAYADGAHLVLHSDRRADALVLEALIATKPGSDLIPKLVRGLLDHRTAGRWSSTQENSFVLLALDRYFQEYEKTTPNFVARAWLGDAYAGEHRFRGRTTERHHIDIPMAWLADHPGGQDLVLAKQGKGRMYYRVGLRYAPRDLQLPARDAGFVVERRYEAVDDPTDVRRDPDGTWRIAAGARVRVRLQMVADGRRYHVALVDSLPAGLEPLNPALATTGSLPPDPTDDAADGWWWWRRTWYEHQNLRDERVEAFTSLLWSGVHDYDYVARATTPGVFVVPPPRAEEMYHPETFGRGRSDRVIVE